LVKSEFLGIDWIFKTGGGILALKERKIPNRRCKKIYSKSTSNQVSKQPVSARSSATSSSTFKYVAFSLITKYVPNKTE
jgi:hypothetical protein